MHQNKQIQGKCYKLIIGNFTRIPLYNSMGKKQREPQHEPAESKSVILCLRFIELIQKNQSHHNSR